MELQGRAIPWAEQRAAPRAGTVSPVVFSVTSHPALGLSSDQR